ncbi:MAG: serine hydrolase, partial [Phycisphaerales bacterium]
LNRSRPSMWTRAIAWIVVGVVLSGCVTAYDPQSPSMTSLETRARQVGTVTPAAKAPAAPARRSPWAKVAPVVPVATATPAPLPPPPPTPRVSAQPSGAVEPPQTPAGKQLAWLAGVLSGTPLERPRFVARRFSPAFLAKVPETQFRAIVRQWRRDQIGDGTARIVRLEGESDGSLSAVVQGVVSGKHTRVRLGVDAEGRINELWFAPAPDFVPEGIEDWADVDNRLAKLQGTSGTLSLGAYEIAAGGAADGGASASVPRAIHRLAADRPLAIGSAFKLYVLGALAEEVAAGRIGWSDKLAIRDSLKSLPSGTMQLHQEGIEFPVSRFAELMISISDNTATDHLITRLGRSRIEGYNARVSASAALNRPFLSTMDMFRMKLGPNRTLAERYAAADEAGRNTLLDGEVAKSLPSFAAAALWRAPFLIDRVEWFATADDLARVMADLHRLELTDPELARILRINPGFAFDPTAWKSIAFKGGSEPGVLNLTWLLERRDGRWFVLTLGWNDTKKPVDQTRLIEAAGAAAHLLASEK